MTIDGLNALDQSSFTAAAGWIFEHSPWVAERAWAMRPFQDTGELHRAMVVEVERASSGEQLALLRAHPDLGTRARLSQASFSEQAGAGLGQLTREEFDLFTRLNQGYKERFGFPFLFAVKGSTKQEILKELERRISSSIRDEHQEALRQVYRIAEFRLIELVSEER